MTEVISNFATRQPVDCGQYQASHKRFPSLEDVRNQPPGYALECAYRAIRRSEPAIRAWSQPILPVDPQQGVTCSGPLAAVPFGVKDVIDLAGVPTLCGSGASDPTPAAFHAVCVQMLVSAGAIALGKTVTAEYAFRGPGLTKNPCNLAHTPGGSSSGSAAAVAAGMVPLALSTQTGGSIIRPAAYCGVPALKPSFGLVSRSGMQLTSESLDTIGWHASDMQWLRLAAEVLLPLTQRHQPQPLSTLNVAVIDTAPEGSLQAEGRKALDHVIVALKRAGAQCAVVDAGRSLDLLARAHGVIMKYEFARNLAPVVHAARGVLSSSLLRNIQEGFETPASLYLEMCALQQEMRMQWDDLTLGADVILTPPAAGAAPAGTGFTGAPTFNKCWTVLGWPCLHLPILRTAQGLPVGIQLVGRWREDFELLSHGAQLEMELNQC